jgi:hypothetical protein
MPLELDAMQGRSILPVLRGGRDPSPRLRFVLGQIYYPSKMVGESLQVGGFKLIHTERDRRGKQDVWELYHVLSDPAEKRNLLGEDPERDAEYRRRLAELQALTARSAHATEKTVLDEETEDMLRALGYVP